jgi:hypothetical protein
MNRPALPSFFPKNGSAFPPSMFTTNPRTWNAPVVTEPKVAPPPAGKNGKATVSHTDRDTGTNPLAQNLFGAKKGGKRSKTRRLSKKRRVTRQRRRR